MPLIMMYIGWLIVGDEYLFTHGANMPTWYPLLGLFVSFVLPFLIVAIWHWIFGPPGESQKYAPDGFPGWWNRQDDNE